MVIVLPVEGCPWYRCFVLPASICHGFQTVQVGFTEGCSSRMLPLELPMKLEFVRLHLFQLRETSCEARLEDWAIILTEVKINSAIDEFLRESEGPILTPQICAWFWQPFWFPILLSKNATPKENPIKSLIL